MFLSQQYMNMFWDIDLNEWLELVEFEKEMEELELEVSNTDEIEKENKREGVK